jgi:hypothetical protein
MNVSANASGTDRSPDGARPSQAQLRYLALGLRQPGGKLPLFDENGREISPKTIRSCIERGWAEPWFDNPLKPNWLVCRLTPAGRIAAAD